MDSLNSTAIRVRWKPVPKQLSNGNIRGYQVAYVKSDVPTSQTTIVSTYEGELSEIEENQILVNLLVILQSLTTISLRAVSHNQYYVLGCNEQSIIFVKKGYLAILDQWFSTFLKW